MQGVGGVGGGRTSSAVVHTPMCNNKAVIITPVCVCMRARGLCVCWVCRRLSPCPEQQPRVGCVVWFGSVQFSWFSSV
jgi:hypothetical protein